jgi:hypothetical protein
MELGDYYHLIPPLTGPNDDQIERFSLHVLEVHSWYKHLPLEGAEFVVFVDPTRGAASTRPDHGCGAAAVCPRLESNAS